MSHIASPYFVRRTDRDAVAGLGTKVSLLLDDNYYAIACIISAFRPSSCTLTVPKRTDFRGSLRPQDIDTLDYRGAGVVDAVYESLDCDA
jgi:hypothetical protein